jgi:ubiquinone/menaquinone biosynthesis C-methylase UbiE
MGTTAPRRESTARARGPARWFFDAWSHVYDVDLVQRLTYRPVHDAIVEALSTRPPGRVLDLACGTGLLATRLERTFANAGVVGCDYSRGMLLRAAARLPEGAWVQADAQRLPFPDRAFDAVVCTEALHWFPDQARALAECRRVLAPGGRVLVAVVNVPAQPIGDLVHLASRIVGQPFRWPTRAAMRALFAAAGLEVEAQRRIFRIPAGVLLPPVLTIGVRGPQAP